MPTNTLQSLINSLSSGSTYSANYNPANYTSINSGNIGLNGGSGNGNYYINATNNTSYSSQKIITEADLKTIVLDRLEKIEKRLAILVPDPLKLEKYEALKKAYDHYKTLEILLND